jgi:hemoglobin-like flavoprotein
VEEVREMLHKTEKAVAICKRAAELRAIAENIQDCENHEALLRWAESYEELAHCIIDTRDRENLRLPMRLIASR